MFRGKYDRELARVQDIITMPMEEVKRSDIQELRRCLGVIVNDEIGITQNWLPTLMASARSFISGYNKMMDKEKEKIMESFRKAESDKNISDLMSVMFDISSEITFYLGFELKYVSYDSRLIKDLCYNKAMEFVRDHGIGEDYLTDMQAYCLAIVNSDEFKAALDGLDHKTDSDDK